MAGHSKWKNIQHRKGRQDALRAKAFTKISKEIFAAARSGGGDPNTNTRLRMAIAKAKAVNMPNDNVERTLKKALGELDGVQYEEITYEGYGPGGIAIMVDVLTDNKNRSAAEVRLAFNKNGGSLGESGCVSFMFQRKGLLIVDREQYDLDEDEFTLEAIEAGADDIHVEADSFEIITSAEDFETVKTILEGLNIEFSTAEVTMLPETKTELTGDEVLQTIKLIEMLEDNDDVQNVYTNLELSEETLEQLNN
ncbi:MAG TPA: YebC/PmpR family DNA-binding transcriptional regulator [Bacilli bacterium]|nr:YebC/PmpR family DNA-binding transcriptional regulator [Bacilli bacterium]